jgi:hypothetical protein
VEAPSQDLARPERPSRALLALVALLPFHMVALLDMRPPWHRSLEAVCRFRRRPSSSALLQFDLRHGVVVMSDQRGDIFASAEIEALAASKTTSADRYADEFVRFAHLVPEMPTDRETVLSWFAAAIEAGRAAAGASPQSTGELDLVCTCGWTGASWAAAKDHILAAMKANQQADTPVTHEVTEAWPTASCCGEPRVSRDVDACYDHAKLSPSGEPEVPDA